MQTSSSNAIRIGTESIIRKLKWELLKNFSYANCLANFVHSALMILIFEIFQTFWCCISLKWLQWPCSLWLFEVHEYIYYSQKVQLNIFGILSLQKEGFAWKIYSANYPAKLRILFSSWETWCYVDRGHIRLKP